MPAALVLDGGSGPALAVTRSLGRDGWRVLGCAGTRSAASRHTAASYLVPDAADDVDGFATAVAAVVEREDVDVVVPCTDASAEVLWQHEHELGTTRILGGDRASFELCSDKARALAAAERAGFGVPAWSAPATVDEARAALESVGLPCVVKPRRSYVREGKGLRHRRHVFVRRPAELEPALRREAEPGGELPVVQAYVPGRALAVTAVVHEGRVLGRVARETLSFDPIAGGTSVWKRTVPAGEVGVEAAVELLLAIGYEGLAEVEYQVDAAGEPRLMEIGARAHGWLGLAVAAGVDVPAIAARALVSDAPAPQLGYRAGVDMRWPAGELSRLRRLARREQLPPGVTAWSVVKRAWPPWRPGMRYDGVTLSDPVPWLPRAVRDRAPHARAAR